MPPNDDTGEIELETGITPETTPILEVAAPDATPVVDKIDPQPSSGQDDTTKADEPKTMAEAIAAALVSDKPDTTPDAAAAVVAEATPVAAVVEDPSNAPAEEGKDDESADPTDDELKGLKAPVAKRIKQLLSQRNTARRELEASSEDASHYRNIREFMATSDLADSEVSDLFKIGKLLKGNDVKGYEEALDMVLPIAQQLLEMTGRSLPKDVQAQVEAGELTEDAARELALTRTRALTAEKRATTVETRVATQEQNANSAAHSTAIKTAVLAWDTRTRASDLDFGLKAEALQSAAQTILLQRGPPKSPADAVAYAEAAYANVNKWFSAAKPAPKATRATPAPGTNGNRGALAPAPGSLAEAIRGAIKTA